MAPLAEATHWTIDVDAVGSFVPAVSPPLPARHGNFRINVGDTLIINLVAGSLMNQKDVQLIIRNGIGAKTTISGLMDSLGNQKFQWEADEKSSGPCCFVFEYCPFHAESYHKQMGVINRVIVEPRLHINGKVLPISSLSMQTVMSRCLGSLDKWVSSLESASSDLNYNVIHFTPVQVTGESGSCYSLANQLEMSSDLLPSNSKKDGFEILKDVVKELETRCGILSMSDIVLNHTANDTHWLSEHPECGYNEKNSPHLTAAIELDQALQKFSLAIAEGKYHQRGLSPVIQDEGSLQVLRHILKEVVVDRFKMNQWFQIDIDSSVSDFNNENQVKFEEMSAAKAQESLLQECLRTVGVARLNGVRPRASVTRQLFRSGNDLRQALQSAQKDLGRRCGEVSESILNAVEGFVRWERVQCFKGPVGTSHWDALVPRYFTPTKTTSGETLHLANNGWVMDWDAEKDFAGPGSLVYFSRSLVVWSDCVKLRFGNAPEDCPFLWNLMKDYCAKTASIFHGIRLDNCHSTPIEVAKYCLTESRKVNPNLWVYAELFTGKRETDLKFERELGLNALIREAMQSYNPHNLAHHIEEFGGRRIGTLDPIPSLHRLGEKEPQPLYQKLSPNIFFDCTHDNETPYQKRVAVDALSNAAAVTASTCALGSCRGYDELVPKVLSVVTERRHYHNYSSNSPVQDDTAKPKNVIISTMMHAGSGSVSVKGSWDGWRQELTLNRVDGSWTSELPSQFIPTDPKILVEYQFKFIADGDNWFHDGSIPHAKDQYGNINNSLSMGPKSATSSMIDARLWKSGNALPGIMEARKVLNEVHRVLGDEGFTEADTKTYGDNIIVATRHNPQTHSMYVFFIHSAFNPSHSANPEVVHEIKGKIDEVVLEAKLNVPHNAHFVDEHDRINGLPSMLEMRQHLKGSDSSLHLFSSRYDERTNRTVVSLSNFPPGSVFIVKTPGFPHVREAVANSILELGNISQGVPGKAISRAEELQAFSYLLYSCASEEKDRSKGARGCYEISGIGALPYAGIGSLIPLLDKIRYQGDLQHPLISNVVAGDWLFEYLADRLDSAKDDPFSGGVVVVLLKAASWLRETFREPLRHLDRKLLGYYLDWVISSLYGWVTQKVMSGMPDNLRLSDDPYVIRLSLATLQFYSYVPSSPLIYGTTHPSLSAGLPHFSTNYMRAWGRDTFIALKGCLLVTGRYQEAKEEILGFARVMRHGLIPNLLDSGNNPRFNARDATWFFLQSIQDYCTLAPEGTEFLETRVDLKYREALPAGFTVDTIADLMHCMLSLHAQGIQFREWNAGTKIDSCMKDEGFNIKITFDPNTGLIFGGNKHNCGTWMDKMGSSNEAGTMGVPATPRDGAAVEIIGLLKSTLRFVSSLPSSVFQYTVADASSGMTYKQWDSLLQKSFENVFFVGDNDTPGIDRKLVNRTNIVRDSVNASEAWRDYQLRCNCCVALSVAPELLSTENALKSLESVSKVLYSAKSAEEMEATLSKVAARVNGDAAEVSRQGQQQCPKGITFTPQLGLKTLDPSDFNYRPNYNNDDRSTDATISAGFNYHNGPEWVWPVGYFLDALFEYTKSSVKGISGADALHKARFETMRYLLVQRQHMATDPWISLPELTDEEGGFCAFSCTAQAWSVGTVLAFLSRASSTGCLSPRSSTQASPNEPISPETA